MYARPLIPELRLSDNGRHRFFWNESNRELSLQVWRPMSARDGHGFLYTSQVVLSGDDLTAFVSATAGLQGGPEPLMAA